MKLKEQIQKDKISAMKEKNVVKRNVLSVLLGEIESARGKTGKELTETEIVKLIKKMIGNNVLTKDEDESEYLYGYLPKELSEKELVNLITEFVKMNNVSSMKEMGKVMGYLSKSFPNMYDGTTASKIVKSLLF